MTETVVESLEARRETSSEKESESHADTVETVAVRGGRNGGSRDGRVNKGRGRGVRGRGAGHGRGVTVTQTRGIMGNGRMVTIISHQQLSLKNRLV